jgi:tight adherence protein B
MRTRRLGVALLWLVVLLLPGPALAQQDRLAVDENVNDDEYPIVEVTVTVPEQFGGTRLSKEPFTIIEDGREIQPYLGASPETEQPPPPEVALAIDVSRSMRDSIARARKAARSFVASLPADSQVALVTFGDDAKVLVPPTTRHSEVESAISTVRATDSNTALYDGVQEAAGLLSIGDGERGTVVLLSDGKDTTDTGSRDGAAQRLADQRANLWAVALPDRDGQVASDDLEALAGDGGRVLPADGAAQLDEIYTNLASDLNRTYVLRYESQASGRTELTVQLNADGYQDGRTLDVVIDDSGAPQARPAPVTTIDAEPSTITVPLLGTFGAYVVGLAALAAGVLTLLLILLLPSPPRPQQRLFVESATRQGPRLTSLAQWTTDFTDRRLQQGSFGERVDHFLERAGLNIRPGELVVAVVSAMVVAYAIGALSFGALFGLLLMAVPPIGIRLWLSGRRDRRQAAFSDQLTDVLQLVGSSLRAGYGLTQGIDAVSRDADEPASSEFRRIIIEHRLGRDLTDAMGNCATRMDNADFAWVVQAIGIHREVGGDLSKVLDNIVNTIRDRADVHRQVRTLSAEGRLSARVLTGLPILVLCGLWTMSPDYMRPLVENTLGLVLLAIAAVLMIIGVLVIRQMSRIQY